MGLYNFKARFAPFVLDGSKTHTIRAVRANPDKPGNKVHLYTGLRTKKAKLLFRSVCVKVEEIFIRELTDGPAINVNGLDLDDSECNALAYRDGFRSRGTDGAFAEMMEFWEGRLPFEGHVIHWKYPGVK